MDVSDIEMCVFTILFTKTAKQCSLNHAVLLVIYWRRPNAWKRACQYSALYSCYVNAHRQKKITIMGSKIWRKIDYLKWKYACTHLHVQMCVYTCVSAPGVAWISVSSLYQFKWNSTKPNIIRHIVFVVSMC